MEIKKNQEILSLLSISHDDINSETIKKLLASTSESEAKFEPTDKFILPKNKLYNKEEIETTVGRYDRTTYWLYQLSC